MFININAFGYDLELKFRKKANFATQVILVPDEDMRDATVKLIEALG